MNCDYLIVGGGPAGSLVSLLLARSGKSVVLLESKTRMGRKICGEYLCPAGVKLLRSLELSFDFEKEFLPIFGMNLYSKNSFVSSKFLNNEIGLSVNREKFDSKLLDLSAKAGTQQFFGEHAQKFEALENSIHVTTLSGLLFETNFLIGADGRLSTVAREFGLNKTKANNFERVAIHQNFKPKVTFDRVGEMHLFPDGSYIGIDPIGEDVNVSLVTDKRKLLTDSPAKILEKYLIQSKNILERIDGNSDLKVSTVFPLRHEVVAIQKERVALVVDAAGFFDPLTGEGIYYALLSSSILAELLLTEKVHLYGATYKRLLGQKKMVNFLFQITIKHQIAIDLIASFLLKSREHADYFISLVGNVISPKNYLKWLIFNRRVSKV